MQRPGRARAKPHQQRPAPPATLWRRPTWPNHSLGAPWYALKAVEAAGLSSDAERAWQLEQLPGEVRELVVSAMGNRLARRRP